MLLIVVYSLCSKKIANKNQNKRVFCVGYHISFLTSDKLYLHTLFNQ
jgi:hypothetical protein